MDRIFVALGAVSAAIAVATGAFGAHGLKDRLEPQLLANWNTAAHYQLVHALGIIAIGLFAARLPAPSGTLHWAGWLLLAGTVLFSGSLYALALTGVRTLGAVTPFGGIAFIVGWVLLALVAFRPAP